MRTIRWCLLAIGLGLIAAASTRAHIGGLIYPCYEIADANLAAIDLRDGSIADWENVVGDPQLYAADFYWDPTVGDGAQYDPADLNYRIWLGWNAGQSHVYCAMERTDDVYVNEYAGGGAGDFWKYDSIEFMVDGDHSGGDYTGSADPRWTAEEQKLNNNRTAQQYLAMGDTPVGTNIGYLGAAAAWVNRVPYSDGYGSTVGQGPATTVLEFYVTPFDDLIWNSPTDSKTSTLAPGKIIGLNISTPDWDIPGHYHAFATLSGQAATWRYAERFVDVRLVGSGGTPVPPAPVWSVGLTATSSQGVSVSLTLGLAAGATDYVNTALGERELPPIPPSSAFDARWLISGSQGSVTDYRSALVPEAGVMWTLRLQQNAGAAPVTLRWDPAALPDSGALWLQTDGLYPPTNLNMRKESSYQVGWLGSGEVRVLYLPSTYRYTLPSGWSMVSLPCAVAGRNPAAVFPPATSVFRFAGKYELATTLEPGVGYWVNMPGCCYVSVDGPEFTPTELTAALPAGWSMVGPGLARTPVDSLAQAQPSLLSVYGYSSGYYSPGAMTPGSGYWVNMAAAGPLALGGAGGGVGRKVAGGLASVEEGDTGLWAEGNGMRQALTIGVAVDQVVALPPVPPRGLFDARIEVTPGLEAWQAPMTGGPYRLRLQGGVDRLRWQGLTVEGWELVVDGTAIPLVGSGQVRVSPDDAVAVRTRAVAPQVNRLRGAFPNPFNSSTTLTYDLAQAGEVQLQVVSATGQVIRDLVAEYRGPGSYQTAWDGRDDHGSPVGNGMYLCVMTTGGYRVVTRMVLLK